MKRHSAEVYDTDSGLGGSHTVEMVEENSPGKVKVRIWYGRKAASGWECWPEWDGYRFEVNGDELRNNRQKRLFG